MHTYCYGNGCLAQHYLFAFWKNFTMHDSFIFGQAHVESYMEVTVRYFKCLVQYHSTIIKASETIQM